MGESKEEGDRGKLTQGRRRRKEMGEYMNREMVIECRRRGRRKMVVAF